MKIHRDSLVISGWVFLVILTVAIVTVPTLVRLPLPHDALKLNTARFTLGERPAETVMLPHTWPVSLSHGPARATYELTFAIESGLQQPLFLLVPALRHMLSVELNGDPLLGDVARSLWSDPATGTVALVRLPPRLLRSGVNELALTLERESGAISGFLAEIYIGTESSILPNYQVRAVLFDQLRTMGLAAHLLILLGIAVGFLWRRRDVVFSWLVLLGASSLLAAMGQSPTMPSEALRPLLTLVGSSGGLIAIGLALALIEVPRPLGLKAAIAGLPAAALVAALTGLVAPSALVVVFIPIAIAGVFVAAGVLVWAAVRRGDTAAALLAAPLFITGWFGARDMVIVLGFLDGGLLLFQHLRPLTVVAVMIILMRRLAVTLNRLDAARDTLVRRLNEQERELSRLHEEERKRTADRVREDERQRLMRDLHDGLSGHLVSIIALAENPKPDRAAIERAAREALDDLRLVIHSLDIGDRDLPVALASFRERLATRLRRIGIGLDWSMESLPEISGVTPGNALGVLRILQEAVTNAVKHGPASRIAIRGRPDGNGGALLIVENDGAAGAGDGTGSGMRNMRHRAAALGATVRLECTDAGIELMLVLPGALPQAVED